MNSTKTSLFPATTELHTCSGAAFGLSGLSSTRYSINMPHQLADSELDLIGPMLNQHDYGWSASFQGLILRTALQPIFSIAHKRVVGYEALVRTFDTDNASVLPIHLFQLPTSEPENVLLDRLCRYLHVQNYSSFSDQVNWLFLNVSPKVVANGRHSDSFFGRLLERTGLSPLPFDRGCPYVRHPVTGVLPQRQPSGAVLRHTLPVADPHLRCLPGLFGRIQLMGTS